MTKNLATLESELATFEAWFDSNPMKKTLIELTKRDIARLKSAQESEARKQAAIAKQAAFNALPWYKKLFRSA
jgi:hypothetical protein